MRRLFLAAALVLAACGSTNATVPSGQLSAPSGIAAVSAGDRDVVFIANSGRDGLVAFQLCNHATLDGGIDPSDTCSAQEDGQYLPGPIRVLTGTIETGERTARVAGARLTQPAPDGGTIQNGEALTVGTDETVRVVDARVLVDAQEQRIAAADAGPVLAPLPIGGLGVDIVAANTLDGDDLETGSPSVRVFVATVAPPQLIAMTATLAPSGAAQLPTIDGRCDLGAVLPKRIAVAPGSGDAVYVADGAVHGGVVKVNAADILKGGTCPSSQRISAGGRPVVSLALSPPWYEGSAAAPIPHPSGELLMMVLEPLPGSTPGREVDAGGVLLARTSDLAILPVPPFDYRETGHAPMQPLVPLRATGGGTVIAREATFLRSIKPAPDGCLAAPCTPLYMGNASNASAVGIQYFDLIAAVSSSDGTTTFIEPPRRRFATADRFLLPVAPTLLNPLAVPIQQNGSGAGTLQPTPSDPGAATLTTDSTASVPGVARDSNWRVIWHGPLPGLERRPGTLTRTGAGTVRFVTAPADLGTWTGDPVFKLGAGDAAVVATASSADAACKDVVTAFNTAGAAGTEFTITAISGGDTIDLQQPGVGAVSMDACPKLNATLEVRAGGTQPWLIYNDVTPVARWHTGEPYVAHQRRFDYPLDACPDPKPAYPCYAPDDPLVTSEVAFAFTITGNDPITVSAFGITLTAPLPATVSDPTVVAGLPAGILSYSSPRHPSLLFISLAGANELLQANPGVLGGGTNGVQAYR